MRTLDDLIKHGVKGRRDPGPLRPERPARRLGRPARRHRRRPHPRLAPDAHQAARPRCPGDRRRAPRPAEGRAGPGILARPGRRPAGPAARPPGRVRARHGRRECAAARRRSSTTVSCCCSRTSASTPARRARTTPSGTSSRVASQSSPAARTTAVPSSQDAFGAVHRKHASVYDIATMLPHYCGDLVRDELARPARTHRRPESGPTSSSSAVRRSATSSPSSSRCCPRSTRCSSAAACVSRSSPRRATRSATRCSKPTRSTTVRGSCCRRRATRSCCRPTSSSRADVTDDAPTQIVAADAIPAGMKGLDIGPDSVRRFTEALANARTVFWNGPMGVFELAPFAAGTRAVAEAVAAVSGLSVVGGGDSAAAVRALGLDVNAFGHISTGGGASLEYPRGQDASGRCRPGRGLSGRAHRSAHRSSRATGR